MAIAHRRESMIALRATHQAFKIACDVGYEPIDASRVQCRHCAAELDWENNAVGSVIMCMHCGEVTDVPQHIRAYLPPPPEPPKTAPSRFAGFRLMSIAEDYYGPVPVALAIFFILCVLTVLGMMTYTLISLHSH